MKTVFVTDPRRVVPRWVPVAFTALMLVTLLVHRVSPVELVFGRRLSSVDFEKLKIDMSKFQVWLILGEPDVVEDKPVDAWHYFSEGKGIRLVFQDGLLDTKLQKGLYVGGDGSADWQRDRSLWRPRR